jgi:hypothetical protein
LFSFFSIANCKIYNLKSGIENTFSSADIIYIYLLFKELGMYM